jgi:hypothetical protein
VAQAPRAPFRRQPQQSLLFLLICDVEQQAHTHRDTVTNTFAVFAPVPNSKFQRILSQKIQVYQHVSRKGAKDLSLRLL